MLAVTDTGLPTCPCYYSLLDSGQRGSTRKDLSEGSGAVPDLLLSKHKLYVGAHTGTYVQMGHRPYIFPRSPIYSHCPPDPRIPPLLGVLMQEIWS